MDKQELFSKVRKHLLTQMTKSYSEECGVGNSLYRNKRQERACAIGYLIPDFLYNSYIEGLTFQQLPTHVRNYLGHDNYELCIDLQYVHDALETTQWDEALDALAVKHKLRKE